MLEYNPCKIRSFFWVASSSFYFGEKYIYFLSLLTAFSCFSPLSEIIKYFFCINSVHCKDILADLHSKNSLIVCLFLFFVKDI